MIMTAVLALSSSSCTKPNEDIQCSIKAESVRVSARSGQVFISVKSNSSWKMTLSDPEDESDVTWARLNVDSGEGDRNLLLSYDANTDEVSARSVKVVVSSGGVSDFVIIEQEPAEERPEPEPEEPSDPDLSKVEWMELPAMDDLGLGYYSHSFDMDGKSYRNYTFAWSQQDLVALWVAYPLCKMYTTKRVDRTDDWAFDPLLGEEFSSAPFSYYGRKAPGDKDRDPYDRGHQLPSADRLCCREANAQTFYGTNMTPQLSAHNSGIWADLENKVRNIANVSDTTYVVTGCITEGSKTVVYDSSDKPMTVPVAYFKAVLRYSKSSTVGQWNAAAFYLEHRDYSEALGKQHSMSVDELEDLTGMDFFVNLEAKIGESQAAKVESADPADSSIWW